jgi:hypothetical protein
MTTTPVEVIVMRRNVDEPDPATGDELFCRDCAEYNCRASQRSDRLGAPESLQEPNPVVGDRNRLARLKRSATSSRTHRWGEHNIVVIGDLNEGPAVEG